MSNDLDYQLSLHIKSVDGIPLINISGECDAFTSTFTHGAVTALINEGYKNIIIDMSSLNFLDVAGFHAMDECCRLVRSFGGKMYLVSPENRIAEIYNMLKDQDSCNLVSNIADALALIKQIGQK